SAAGPISPPTGSRAFWSRSRPSRAGGSSSSTTPRASGGGGEDALGLWWRYHGLEPNPFLRRVGYDWSVATLFPALFLTAVVLKTTVFRRARVRAWRPSPGVFRFSVAAGAVSVVLPLVVVSTWLVP